MSRRLRPPPVPRPSPPEAPRRRLVAVATLAVLAGACGTDATSSDDARGGDGTVVDDTAVEDTAAGGEATDADGAGPEVAEKGADAGEAATTVWLDGEVPPLHPSVDGYDAGEVTLAAPDGTTHVLPVRVARTQEEQRHGLMEVTDVPDGTGMLFAFDADRDGGFWMKGTLVPLDIAYVRDDGTIADVLRMEPCTTEDCPSYPPDEPYRRTLEVPAGFFEQVGLDDTWTVEVSGEQ